MRDGFIKVAAGTPKIKVADCRHNAEQIFTLMREASRQGVRVLALPELCLTGATCGDLFLQPTLLKGAEEGLATILEATKHLDMVTALGMPVRYKGNLYNCAVMIHKGEILGKEFTVTGGTISDTPALVLLLAPETNCSRVRAGCQQNTKATVISPVGAHRFDIPIKLKAGSFRQQEFSSKAFCLLLDGIRQCFTAGLGNTGIIHYLMGDGDLSAKLFLFQHQYPILCPGKVQRGGEPRRAAANHDYIIEILHHNWPTRSRLGFRVSAPGFQLAGQT